MRVLELLKINFNYFTILEVYVSSSLESLLPLQQEMSLLQHSLCCFLAVACGLAFSFSWKINYFGQKGSYTALQLPMRYSTLRAKTC